MCEVFTIVDLKDGHVEKIQGLKNLEAPDIGIATPIDLLKKNDVDIVIARGMAQRNLMGLKKSGFEIMHGTRNTVQEDIDAYIKEELSPLDVKHVW